MLRVLEERTFERVGGGRTLHADLRLVAATNRDLQRMVEEGRFRGDLFFRLAVFPIELPPLRERASDVPLLARHLIGEIARRHHLPPPRLAAAAAELLAAQPWPGNVRELANVLERALILGDGPELQPAGLLPLLSAASAPAGAQAMPAEEGQGARPGRRAQIPALKRWFVGMRRDGTGRPPDWPNGTEPRRATSSSSKA